jgi:uncharacterized membrane protein YGL010W
MGAASGRGEEQVRRVDVLFERYGESHRDPANKTIHWICVPLITWSLLAAVWSWTPLAAVVLIVAALGFYVWMSPALAIGMLLVTVAMIAPLPLLGAWVLPGAIAVFVVAWIGQFAGHRIEGRKPSFLEDLKFLLVGPAWLLASVYRRLGLRY